MLICRQKTWKRKRCEMCVLLGYFEITTPPRVPTDTAQVSFKKWKECSRTPRIILQFSFWTFLIFWDFEKRKKKIVLFYFFQYYKICIYWNTQKRMSGNQLSLTLDIRKKEMHGMKKMSHRMWEDGWSTETDLRQKCLAFHCSQHQLFYRSPVKKGYQVPKQVTQKSYFLYDSKETHNR